jgi:hypothetical protein
MLFDFEAISPRDRYKLLISTIVPRPIASVVTQDPAGVRNAACTAPAGMRARPTCSNCRASKWRPGMSAKPALALSLGLVLAGCVAPEEPPPPVRQAPSAASSVPRANLEEAPIPNRRLRGPSDSMIRIQQ